ncbi:NnrS family protein [Methylocystis sp. FS]|uniref:NnrS family protein n=1 Tax=Methylocystis TaxID=133 RepID=UPI0015828F61|nr:MULTISPECIES: NnrS family protein [Methylocystis]MBG0800384.1 NnrS family protein [Methylocystis sp. H4A]NUJ81695.1 NnrS family protein [Methylocystis silviterrae]
MAAIPRYRPQAGPAVLSAGFRPFFLVSALWAFLVIPIWIAFFAGHGQVPTALPPVVWHVHEMVFGFGAATVAGFLLTAIPNWTGRMPLQGGPLALLVLLWAVGRIAVLFSAKIGVDSAAALDLAFPILFLLVVAREIIAGRNWRNLPMLGALLFLLLGNLLVHFESVGIARTAELGNRLGVATLLMLISFIGGRIVPSFTRNWLAKEQPGVAMPAAFDVVDRTVLAVTGLALAVWTLTPEGVATPWIELAAGLMLGVRLARWRGEATLREPLLWVLHLGYGWLSLGFLLLAFNNLLPLLPQTTALHALTVGAIGTMILAVMTRASLGHTGRPLVAGPGTTAIYVLVTLAAILRLLAPLDSAWYLLMLSLAGAAWSAAFGLFVLLYARPLVRPRVIGEDARPI